MTSGKRVLLSGNEAIARGAYESGVALACGYPGTPSTEILETITAQTEIMAQWSPNEKVALEVGLGASFAGARALVTMKHVGLNVAADPLFTAAYIGAKGGLVIVSADDPGLHSSQNEQDNRRYARFAKLPMLSPSDSQEAKDFTIAAFDLSEKFETPVLLNVTTRICHSKSLVSTGEPAELNRTYHFEKNAGRFVMIPAHARKRHVVLEEKLLVLRAFAETSPLNRVVGERQGAPLGVICAGVSYQYVREMFPDVPVLKLGFLHPLPLDKIRAFAGRVREVVVVEELDDVILEQVLEAGIKARGKKLSFACGELNPDRVRAIIENLPDPALAAPDASLPPPRPPAMCPGCGHRGVFQVLKMLKAIVVGDIGCYTLGTLPPLNALDTCVCMGASITNGNGLRRVLPPNEARQVVSVIGDSTFFHSGLTGVMDAVYNGGGGTIVILDNRTTAMTGLQEHAGTGKTLRGEPAVELDAAEVCRALGVKFVRTVNSFDLPVVKQTIQEALDFDGVSVVVCRHRCVLLDRGAERKALRVDLGKCKSCGRCLQLGCRAIAKAGDGAVCIDPLLCTGCGQCVFVCAFDAIAALEM